jgi:hypothetical protein
MKEEEYPFMPPGMTWRVGVSVFGGIVFLIFLILFLAFYPTNFTTFQNFAIILVALLVLGAVNAAMWVPWGMRWGRKAEMWGMCMEMGTKKTRKK